MARRWQISPADEVVVRQLVRALGVSAITAQILANRGLASPDSSRDFLARKLTQLHDPERLPGISVAADRIVAALRAQRRITVYGDYDVDGVTAVSLLWHCLKLAGGQVDYYIPSRMEEGYGLNCDALRQLHAEDPSRLVITVDCGITSCAEAALARELGLELIITDHHQPDREFPAADVLVHPRLPGEYPFGELCGVGVAFKLAWAVCARLGDGRKASPAMREFLLSALGLTAIGTVADCVPLVDENRVIVHYGLQSLGDRASLGMRELLRVAGLSQRGSLQAEDVAFSLAPRINAAGRLGQARLAVELLTTDQPDRAVALAKYLDELNRNRQTVERKMLKQAKELVAETDAWSSEAALVLAHQEWHPGVIGIVAGRVAEHFQKPAILIALSDREFAQGSGRSFGGYNLHAGVTVCREHLAGFGGHHAAVGLKIAPHQIENFRREFVRCVSSDADAPAPVDEIRIDAEVRLADINTRSVLELEQLGPFGMQNRRPILAASRVELAGPPKKMGEGERHLALTLRQYGVTIRAVAFGRAEWAEELAAAGPNFSICFQPVINRFNGQERAELQLMDWQPTPAGAPVASRT